jgi:hypothetical protein
MHLVNPSVSWKKKASYLVMIRSHCHSSLHTSALEAPVISTH